MAIVSSILEYISANLVIFCTTLDQCILKAALHEISKIVKVYKYFKRLTTNDIVMLFNKLYVYHFIVKVDYIVLLY